MQYERAVAASVPIASQPHPGDGRVYLTGTVRKRGGDFELEQRLDLDTGTARRWMIPRIYRVIATEATQAALQASVGQVVTIVGTPDSGGTRYRTAISLESVRPIGPGAESD
jgi:hypothetical protein